jgi:hypothetical protein
MAAGDLHTGADALLAEHRLVAGAPLAAAASMLNPGNTDAIAGPARCHTKADCDDLTDWFMAKRTRKITR